MLKKEKVKNVPAGPGVYWFKRGRDFLYIGKASSLRDRVRTYFASAQLLAGRGPRLTQMMTLATSVGWQVTDSVLDALILEAQLIRKYQPKYNVKEKDDKSYLYVVLTKEDFPRVLMARGRNLEARSYKLEASFGPFPQSAELRAALKIIRRLFPYRDRCEPGQGKPCFNHELGLCPGVCVGKIGKNDYQRTIRQIKLLLGGRKQTLLGDLRRLMRQAAARQEFEQAALWRNRLRALEHLRDVSLIKRDEAGGLADAVNRFEAYDVAHLAGREAVGVMTVAEAGRLKPNEYRKFKVAHGADDLANLREVLERRFRHNEWPKPGLVVVDGGLNQLKVAKLTLSPGIKLVAVTKNEKHKPVKILTNTGARLTPAERRVILLLNAEAHRFAIAFHRARRKI